MKLPQQLDRYMLASVEARASLRTWLEQSGVEYEFHEEQEVVAGHTLYVLAVKQTSLTFKQRLTNATNT